MQKRGLLQQSKLLGESYAIKIKNLNVVSVHRLKSVYTTCKDNAGHVAIKSFKEARLVKSTSRNQHYSERQKKRIESRQVEFR